MKLYVVLDADRYILGVAATRHAANLCIEEQAEYYLDTKAWIVEEKEFIELPRAKEAA